METLKEAVEEMERRYELMEGAKVSHLTDYNVVTGERLRRRVLIIDEYADLMTSKGTTKELELLIQRICQKGRAAGFHLLLATQRPDAKVVTGVIKANLQMRIALKDRCGQIRSQHRRRRWFVFLQVSADRKDV